MKHKAWLLSALVTLTAVSVLAQTSNSVPPAEAKPAKASKPKAKHAKAATVKTNLVITLDPPVEAVVKCDVLDVRGQGSFTGEVITHVKKGETVTVTEEITLAHVHPNEPSQWSKIVMPTNTPVWVSAEFIDPESKAVRVKKVNVRGGPGENYSIVARLDKGTTVKEIRKQAGWLEIETPTNAFAFVASEFLERATPVLAAAPPPAEVAPAPAPVVVNVPPQTVPAPAQPVETPPAPAPAPTPTPPPVGLTAPAPTPVSQAEQEAHPVAAPAPTATPPEAAKEESPRVVTREGFVRRAYNIQAPEAYELRDIKTSELTEYLQPQPGKKFKMYVGKRVRVTGSEFLDPLWPRTPVLHVETIDPMP